MTISRRAALSYATILGLPPTLIQSAVSLAQTGPRVRQNIQIFAQDPQKVAALRAGVRKMKDRSRVNKDDPLGYYYWSAVHGTTDRVPPVLQSVYKQCEHSPFQNDGSPSFIAKHFISWHRAFLFFFEATLKQGAQEACVMTPFELPYWNWYVDGDMPGIFTEGTENSNPLWHHRVSTAVGTLDKSAFAQPDLLPPSLRHWRKSFSVPLELDPHGAVHDVIGGDMGKITLSARDPIFWLHHANIDRLWTIWIKCAAADDHGACVGGNNPSDPTWTQRVFIFDTAGQMKKTAGTVTDESNLNYRYDDEAPIAAPPRVAMPVEMVQVEGAPVSVQSDGQTTVSWAGPLSLGNRSVAIDLKLSETAQRNLEGFASGAPGRVFITGAWLVLDNVEIGPDGRNGGFSFAIIATLPDGARGVRLGQLGTFTWPTTTSALGAHDAHVLKPVTLTIPLKEVLEELGVADSGYLAKGLRVVFQAAHRENTSNPEFVRIGAISIKTTSVSGEGHR